MNKSITLIAIAVFLGACSSNPAGSGDKNTREVVTAEGKTVTRKKVCHKVKDSTGSRLSRECKWVNAD